MADAGFLEGVPVGQVAGQSVDVADDDHVDLVGLMAAIRSPNPSRVTSLNAEYPSSLKVAATVQPRRVGWSVPRSI